MTKPFEPKIRINPSTQEKLVLDEWLEVEEGASVKPVVLSVWYHRRHGRWSWLKRLLPTREGALHLTIRDHCAFQDWFAQRYWATEEEATTEEKEP